MALPAGSGVMRRLPLGLVALCMAVLLCTLAPATVRAEGIAARSASLSATAEGYRLEAAFDIRMPPGLLELVNRGVPVHFVVEFELSRSRWYWFDERPVRLTQSYTLTYLPLLKQYRLASGGASQNFSRLDDALRALSRVRAWTVAERGALESAAGYTAGLRMRLDTARLPKPLQLSAAASQEWSLASDWYRWSVDP